MPAVKKFSAALLRPGLTVSTTVSTSASTTDSTSASTTALPKASAAAGASGGPLPTSATRPPKAPPPRKASHAAECERLEQLPNIGPSLAADLRELGVLHPSELKDQDPLLLYQQLCQRRGTRQDPCVLDTFMAAVDFMRGAPPQAWWAYTAERKLRHGPV